ncbi:hypothetical protein SUGI_1030930 [Cryptomeria japonica]|uniref:chaperone protein dnaJ 11, chloroplastic n=1 Tax=Cryptomeria japonica TaxID=3369 RepID=UPI0024149765|nr:chaperone protein dnaJ 11, chloroplastic [Cryptomeria japonica]GLJ48882.1 hypothetical protein SUGI_1030930 [Cryptomeria japonica]
MKISWAAGSLRNVSPLKIGGPGIKSPCSLTPPNSPSSVPLSSNRHSDNRAVRASATFNGSSTHQERRDREKKNHYALLGVPCDASHEDIRVAYRRLALQFHPDVVPLQQMECATSVFSQINGAYDTLSDPHKRKAYDEALQPVALKGFTGRPAKGFSSPARSPRGNNWETDQCWC